MAWYSSVNMSLYSAREGSELSWHCIARSMGHCIVEQKVDSLNGIV